MILHRYAIGELDLKVSEWFNQLVSSDTKITDRLNSGKKSLVKGLELQ